MALSSKQQKFVDAFAGNASEAARLAGYTGSDATIGQTAYRLLKLDEVKAAIKAREKKEARAAILTRQQRQELWTKVALDKAQKMSDRLRASELLGKSEADFTEKLEVRGELTLRDLVNEAREQPVQTSAPTPVKPGPEGT